MSRRPNQYTPPPKPAVVRKRLRALFNKRDRLDKELGIVRRSIAVQVRMLSSIEGLVTPMRPEQAYREVFRDDD